MSRRLAGTCALISGGPIGLCSSWNDVGNTASSHLLRERQSLGRLVARVLLLVAGLKMKLKLGVSWSLLLRRRRAGFLFIRALFLCTETPMNSAPPTAAKLDSEYFRGQCVFILIVIQRNSESRRRPRQMRYRALLTFHHFTGVNLCFVAL